MGGCYAKPRFTFGPLSIFIQDELQSYWHRTPKTDERYYIVIDLGDGFEPLPNYPERRDTVIHLMRWIQRSLTEVSFVEIDEFKHDYGCEERILALSGTKKDGSIATKQGLLDLLSPPMARLRWRYSFENQLLKLDAA